MYEFIYTFIYLLYLSIFCKRIKEIGVDENIIKGSRAGK